MSAFKSAFGGVMGIFAAIGVCLILVAGTFLFLCGGGLYVGGKVVNDAAEQARRQRNPVVLQEQARVENVKQEFRAREQKAEPPAAAPAPVAGGQAAEVEAAAELSPAEESLVGVDQAQPAPRAAAEKSDDDKAEGLLKAARGLLPVNKTAAHKRLRALIEKYPDTAAAGRARELLKK